MSFKRGSTVVRFYCRKGENKWKTNQNSLFFFPPGCVGREKKWSELRKQAYDNISSYLASKAERMKAKRKDPAAKQAVPISQESVSISQEAVPISVSISEEAVLPAEQVVPAAKQAVLITEHAVPTRAEKESVSTCKVYNQHNLQGLNMPTIPPRQQACDESISGQEQTGVAEPKPTKIPKLDCPSS